MNDESTTSTSIETALSAQHEETNEILTSTANLEEGTKDVENDGSHAAVAETSSSDEVNTLGESHVGNLIGVK